MTLEEAIVARLEGTAPLAALIGTRIYPDVLPQGVVYPAVRYFQVSNVRHSAFGNDTGIARPRMQFDCWAETRAATFAVRDELRKALQRWRQVGPPEVLDTFVENDSSIPETDERLFRHEIEFTVIWREGV